MQGAYTFVHGPNTAPWNEAAGDVLLTGTGSHVPTIIRSPTFSRCDSISMTYHGGLKMPACCGFTNSFPQYADLPLDVTNFWRNNNAKCALLRQAP